MDSITVKREVYIHMQTQSNLSQRPMINPGFKSEIMGIERWTYGIE